MTAQQRLRLLRKWRRWLHVISRDVFALMSKRRIFRDLTQIVGDNSLLRQPNVFWGWAYDNYANTLAVGIRRQADKDSRAVSMHRLMQELRENAHLLTRKWYMGTYGRGQAIDDRRFRARMANRDFDKFARSGAPRVSKTLIRQDQARFQRAATRIRHHVNRRVAHRDRKRFGTRVTYADLHEALDELDALLRRYTLLLTRAGLLTSEPQIVDDWQSIFRVPWIPPTESAATDDRSFLKSAGG